MPKPVQVSIRTYHVGFGDCFLMSIGYRGGSEKHVLIDFGSMKQANDVPKTRMMDVAEDISARCGGKLTAVIATHRHKDHISGFSVDGLGRGSGALIRALKPDLVIQPWTEDPELDIDATGPILAVQGARLGMMQHVGSLRSMQGVARNYVNEARRNHQYLRALGLDIKERLSFIGEDNIANKAAVKNLMAMGEDGRSEYLHAGQPTRLAALLGVDVEVLGPPTVDQDARVSKQRARDPGEYWHLASHAAKAITTSDSKRRSPLFPDHVVGRLAGQFPIPARWLVNRVRKMRGTQMLQIVRTLDKAMNNTSLILLFRIGSKSLLFPGDAQIENWRYALEQEEWMEKLAYVDVYKVGHHGSLNATPLSLWKKFARKSEDAADPARMTSLLSTLADTHGHAEDRTEVPRATLVAQLRSQSNLVSTQTLAPNDLYRDAVLDVR